MVNMKQEYYNKLRQKAWYLRFFVICYMLGFIVQQIFARIVGFSSNKSILSALLPILIIAIPTWVIMIRYGVIDVLDNIFSLEDYEVFVNEIKSEEKKDELQDNMDIMRAAILLILTIFSYLISVVIILISTVTLLIQALRYKKIDETSAKELLKPIGITWLGAFISYTLLTIAINVFW